MSAIGEDGHAGRASPRVSGDRGRLSVRVEEATIEELDQLVEDGVFHNRSVAVRAALAALLDDREVSPDA
ncbi:MAG: ribbon-helix-helix domain-containing protein [Haloferacaceae archaeon]